MTSSADRETLPEEALRVIEQFTDALWMERGLSRNTLTAYRNDLCGLAGWLQKQGKMLIEAQRQDLLAYCRMDTLGMVRILDKLREVSRNAP